MPNYPVLVPSEFEAEVLKDLGLEIYITGVGVINAALSSFELFLVKKPRIAFLTGWAGAYPETGLKPGDIVIATEEIWVDSGRKYPTHYSPLPEKLGFCNSISFSSNLVEKTSLLLNTCGFEVVWGPLATVCAASYDIKRAAFFQKKYQVLAENMEGFGVAIAAKKAKVSLVEIRVISNLLNKPDEDWDFPTASKRLKEVWECLLRNWK